MGSYHNYFRIFDVETLNDVVLQADKSAFKQKKIGGPLPGNKLGAKNGVRPGGLREAMQVSSGQNNALFVIGEHTFTTSNAQPSTSLPAKRGMDPDMDPDFFFQLQWANNRYLRVGFIPSCVR
jgi:hypothetical protein